MVQFETPNQKYTMLHEVYFVFCILFHSVQSECTPCRCLYLAKSLSYSSNLISEDMFASEYWSKRNIYVETDNVSGPCTCDITVSAAPLTNGYLPNTLQFESISNNDGQCSEFKLVFKNNQTDKTWCGEDNFSITSDNYEMLKMTLEDNGSKHSFEFRISTKDQDNHIRIVCYKPTITTTGSPSSTTTTPSTYIDTDSTSITSINTDSKPITSDLSTSPITSLTSSSGLVHSLNTDLSTTKTVPDEGDIITDKNSRLKNKPENESLLPIILGCSVGGTVIIILILVIGGCVLLRRRNQKTENPKRAEMIITDNDLYVSSDSIPNNNNERGSSMQAEIEIIPNDLYCSSDSLDIDLNDSKQSEPVPNTNNECAVVMKKPKHVPRQDNEIEPKHKPNTVNSNNENIPKDKLNIKRDINRIIGPKGDDYTLVTRD